MQESIVFLVRVQRRCKESSSSLSHLMMSFLFSEVREMATAGFKVSKHRLVKRSIFRSKI